MSLHDERLAAVYEYILAEPDDDTHRLVYADALEEREQGDDRERAEFIRVQVELAQTVPTSLQGAAAERRKRLHHRENELLHAHGLHWGPDLGTVYLFRRGFVAALGNPNYPVAPFALRRLAGVMGRLPLEEITLNGNDTLDPEHWTDYPNAAPIVTALCREILAYRPALERLRHVHLLSLSPAVKLAVYAWLGDRLTLSGWERRCVAVLLWQRVMTTAFDGREELSLVYVRRPGELELWTWDMGLGPANETALVKASGILACPVCGHAPLAPQMRAQPPHSKDQINFIFAPQKQCLACGYQQQ